MSLKPWKKHAYIIIYIHISIDLYIYLSIDPSVTIAMILDFEDFDIGLGEGLIFDITNK